MLHFRFNYHLQTQAMQSQHNKSPPSMVAQFHEPQTQTSRTLEIQSYRQQGDPTKKYIPNKQGELYEAELLNLHS